MSVGSSSQLSCRTPAQVREHRRRQRGEDDVGQEVGAVAEAALAQQQRDVGAVEDVGRAAQVAVERALGRAQQFAVAVQELRRRRGRTRSGARSGGAPGPSGGAPRIISSCSCDSCSETTARARPARSPKRRNSVPLPTPASAATASIVTHAGPQRGEQLLRRGEDLAAVARRRRRARGALRSRAVDEGSVAACGVHCSRTGPQSG